MAYEKFGRFGELAALQVAALVLDRAELFEGFLELAGEARAVQAKRGEGAMKIDDVEGHFLISGGGLIGGRVGGAGKQLGFEEWDAVEALGGVGDFVDQLSLGGGGGGVLIEKLLDVALVGFGVLGGQDGGAGSETVAQGVVR
jgi:hypothetical protein